MVSKIGFNSELFLQEQTQSILQRISQFGGKLYLEVGGKMVRDMHASRVLPGFDPDVKIKLLQKLSDKAEVIFCIYAKDIKGRFLRGDLGVTTDIYLLKMIDDFKKWGIEVSSVAITRFNGESQAEIFKNQLERRGVKVYLHSLIDGYPNVVEKVASDLGFGKNPYIETKKPLVIVSAPCPGSGKLAVCLSQLYHDCQKGFSSGYAKFETFPVWNLPLKHPVNLAYEASTADLGDINMVDPFHLEAYSKVAINYNRDIEIFPVLRKILQKINQGQHIYNSPTDMGVNRVGFAIVDDEAVREASKQELIRRFFRHSCEYAKGIGDQIAISRIQALMEEVNIKPENRSVVKPAREAGIEAKLKGKGHKGVYSGAALELRDGRIITGKNSDLLHASASLFLNAIKVLAGVPDDIHLISPQAISYMGKVKRILSDEQNVSLNLEEVFLALAISANANPTVESCLDKIKKLNGCEAHLTHMPKSGDENGWRKLQVNLTSDPNFSSANLFEE